MIKMDRQNNVLMQKFLTDFYKEESDSVTKSLGLNTSGTRNVIFGSEAFTQFNTNAKFYKSIPKVVWTKSGFRMRTNSNIESGSIGGAVADGGVLPDTTLSEVMEVPILPKIHATRFSKSLLKDKNSEDDEYQMVQEIRNKGIDHNVEINKTLLRNTDDASDIKFTSLDSIASNQAECARLSTPSDNTIYGLSRENSIKFDTYVDQNQSADRVLTRKMLKSLITGIETSSGIRPNVILTGMDTADEIDELYARDVRTSYMRVSYNLNGIQTAKGNDVGFEVSKIYDIPIVRDHHVIKDGSSRVYAYNTNNLFFYTKIPTDYRESKDIFANNSLTEQSIYITAGELVCNNLKTVGKIIDLL